MGSNDAQLKQDVEEFRKKVAEKALQVVHEQMPAKIIHLEKILKVVFFCPWISFSLFLMIMLSKSFFLLIFQLFFFESHI
jgi:hypothetical protein